MTCCGGRRRRSPGGDPHGWNSLDHYLAIHARRLADFTHFIVADDLQVEVIGDSLFMRGRLTCEHGLFIDVVKALDINDRGQVRTRQYAYHAGVSGDADRAIFRYDNHDQKLGHPDRHHCHRFDHRTWTEILPPVAVGFERWPHLSDAIEDLEEWWREVGRHVLPDPDAEASER